MVCSYFNIDREDNLCIPDEPNLGAKKGNERQTSLVQSKQELTNYDKQKCKELWNSFENATISLTAGISLYKAIQVNSHIIRLLNLAKPQRIPTTMPRQMSIIREHMDRNLNDIQGLIAELRSKSPNVVD
ncbi:unnamed protein product [Fasciola hepatica]|uniref:Uncharacterized protein n=1 Tax=Fasciola hepatica TaxID=6192 RepID=A0ABC9HHM8_FASHE